MLLTIFKIGKKRAPFLHKQTRARKPASTNDTATQSLATFRYCTAACFVNHLRINTRSQLTTPPASASAFHLHLANNKSAAR